MYLPSDKGIWNGRVDQNDGIAGQRWHQKIQLIDLSKDALPELKEHQKGIVIIGFRCDEGVRRNKGRVGAKDGPIHLRQACCNHANHFQQSTVIIDGGDVICEGHDLAGAQKELQEFISVLRTKDYFTFVFGGGHEVAFPHFMGLFNAISKGKKLGIINFDAHFDLRKPEDQPSSGTPFFQISKFCNERGQPFNYFCIGIQKSANTQSLFSRAEQLGVNYIFANDLKETTFLEDIKPLQNFIKNVDSLYLTICLDVFDISFAPGVSAPSVLGLFPNIALESIRHIVNSGKLISTDIAELNPSLDHDEKTSKLAARLAFEIITDFQNVP